MNLAIGYLYTIYRILLKQCNEIHSNCPPANEKTKSLFFVGTRIFLDLSYIEYSIIIPTFIKFS